MYYFFEKSVFIKLFVYLSVAEVVLLSLSLAVDRGPGFGRLHAQDPRFSSDVHMLLVSCAHLLSLLDELKMSVTAADCQ